MAGFTNQEWLKILSVVNAEGTKFGLPERRDGSVVLGTFNTLKLGKAEDDAKRWDFLRLMASRFDLLALQEVMDQLDGLRRLHQSLDAGFDLVVSDITGAAPQEAGLKERLAFLYLKNRVGAGELASDITYDRSRVVQSMFDNRQVWQKFFDDFAKDVADAEVAGKKPPTLSDRAHPVFSTFIRTPHCASFRILARGGARPVEFLGINAHMLYGKSEAERRREFDALIEWLVSRAQASTRLYARNLILFGDLNMDFQDPSNPRDVVERDLRGLNKGQLSSVDSASVNFPLLSPHPSSGQFLRTNARGTETFDHIALFIDPNETALPRVPENANAGQHGPDGYDYGVFDYVGLIAKALHGKPFSHLSKAEQDTLFANAKSDISDHKPAWVRLPVPGA
jgi:endonuclease/exonuclease/phosphatase family metal-dependent hydrolase